MLPLFAKTQLLKKLRNATIVILILKSFSLLKVKLQLLSAILFICSPLSKELLSYLASLSWALVNCDENALVTRAPPVLWHTNKSWYHTNNTRLPPSFFIILFVLHNVTCCIDGSSLKCCQLPGRPCMSVSSVEGAIYPANFVHKYCTIWPHSTRRDLFASTDQGQLN